MRIFFAISIPETCQRRIAAARKDIKLNAMPRWVPAENYHLTLHFIDDTTPAEAEKLKAHATAVATKVPAFTCVVGGWGCFPNSRRPRVLYADIHKGREEIITLSRLLQVGGGKQQEQLTPHLTVARSGESATVELSRQATLLAEFTVDRFVLYASELTPTGARYTVLEDYALAGIAKSE